MDGEHHRLKTHRYSDCPSDDDLQNNVHCGSKEFKWPCLQRRDTIQNIPVC